MTMKRYRLADLLAQCAPVAAPVQEPNWGGDVGLERIEAWSVTTTFGPLRLTPPALERATSTGRRTVADDSPLNDARPGPIFNLPPLETIRRRFIAAVLQDTLENDIRRNAMPTIVIDEVIETEPLAFRWHGGDDKGRARVFSRLEEAHSASV